MRGYDADRFTDGLGGVVVLHAENMFQNIETMIARSRADGMISLVPLRFGRRLQNQSLQHTFDRVTAEINRLQYNTLPRSMFLSAWENPEDIRRQPIARRRPAYRPEDWDQMESGPVVRFRAFRAWAACSRALDFLVEGFLDCHGSKNFRVNGHPRHARSSRRTWPSPSTPTRRWKSPW